MPSFLLEPILIMLFGFSSQDGVRENTGCKKCTFEKHKLDAVQIICQSKISHRFSIGFEFHIISSFPTHDLLWPLDQGIINLFVLQTLWRDNKKRKMDTGPGEDTGTGKENSESPG